MSLDRRELLLQQLVSLALAIPGIKNVYRNRPIISEAQKPAIVILDADEEGLLGQFALGRPPSSPGIVRMTPEVCIMAAGPPEQIGSSLSVFRLALIDAILGDEGIAGLVGSTGGAQYQGCVTDLGQGRTMEGLMILHFEIHYPLLIPELQS